MCIRKLHKSKPGRHGFNTLEKRRNKRRPFNSPKAIGTEVSIHKIIEPESRVVIITHCLGKSPDGKAM